MQVLKLPANLLAPFRSLFPYLQENFTAVRLKFAVVFVGMVWASAFGLALRAQTVPIATTAPGFASVLLHPIDGPTLLPHVPLGGSELEFRFDDLEPGYRTLGYRLVPCTWDWKREPRLTAGDCIRGFPELQFPEIVPSFGSRVPYVNYATWFPNDMQEFIRSGNYVVEVYDLARPQEILISRRFVVFEEDATLTVQRLPTRHIASSRTHQELAVTARFGAVRPMDPHRDVHCTVLQNGRWDNALYDWPPRFVQSDALEYAMEPSALFPGGTTWRAADLKSLRFVSTGIARIEDDGGTPRFYLEPAVPRTGAPLRAREDLDGRYVIANELRDFHSGGEYVDVRFVLRAPPPANTPFPYVFGDFTGGVCSEAWRLGWSSGEGAYVGEFLLKQGYYEFLFASCAGPGAPADVTTFEGSHALTDNRYTVLLYVRDLDGRDRAVGRGE